MLKDYFWNKLKNIFGENGKVAQRSIDNKEDKTIQTDIPNDNTNKTHSYRQEESFFKQSYQYQQINKSPSDSKGYYKLLGITTDASQDEIKKAYRKKAHELHPDKNFDKDAVQRFQE